MALGISVWNGSTADWTVSADWSLGEPNASLAALLGGSSGYIVTIDSNVGTIAAAGDAATIGLTLNDAASILDVSSGGTLMVGATNGHGGLVSIASGEIEVAGGSLIATNTLALGGGNAILNVVGGVAGVAALSVAAGSVLVGGTLTISGALAQTGSEVAFAGPGLLALGDVAGTATIDLNELGLAAPGSRVDWTNTAATDLANLTLQNFGADSTLDVATSAAVTITGTTLVSNKLTIATTGGDLVVGLGGNEAAQYFATTTTLVAQNIVRITAGLTTSTWLGVNSNWTAAADWDDGVTPGGSAGNYAVLGGYGSYLVRVTSDVGTIAAAGAVASSVGLTLSGTNGSLLIALGGTLAVGAIDGDGGLVNMDNSFTLDVSIGGSFSATNTLTLAGSDPVFDIEFGMASLGALDVAAGSVQVVYGTLNISGALTQTSGTIDVGQNSGSGTLLVSGALAQTGGAIEFQGFGLIALGDVSGAATIDLDELLYDYPESRVYWTNGATTADLANLTLKNFGGGSTLDVATSAAVTITGSALVGNALTIDTSGGNLVVGLGSGGAAQYFATTVALGAQNAVRISNGGFTSSWIDGTTGNWTTAANWDDAVAPSGSTSLYGAVLGGTGIYTVTVNSNIGAIATVGFGASGVGLTLQCQSGVLDIASGGTLVVGAANGDGGNVSLTSGFALFVDGGGSFSATGTITLETGFFHVFGGVVSVAGLDEYLRENLDIEVANGGTLSISGQLDEEASNVIRFVGSGLISVGDVNGASNLVDLNAAALAAPHSRVYWTNSATTADLANLKLENFGTTSTLDVAIAGAVTITGTTLAVNALTIDTSGGNLVVGLGTGEAAQYFASTTTIGSQNVVEITACFLRGTRIATPGGAVAVEHLREGDAVITRSGVTSVQWIGWRDIECARRPRPQDVLPIRIDPDAFAPGQPSRTLRLSPDHAVFIDGVLIPIRNLVNGATIVQEDAETVSYWHVELPHHDILFAEGLACESYLDTGNRSAFANGGGATMLHPDFALRVWEADACAELVRGGAELEAARSWLLDRAEMLGHRLTRDPGLRLIAGGREIKTDYDADRRVVSATLRENVGRVRLVSRRFVPAHARPANDDWRELGVAVTRVWLDEVEISCDDLRLDAGWRAPEASWRWTDGGATLAVGNAGRLRIEWADAGLYWDAEEAGRMSVGHMA